MFWRIALRGLAACIVVVVVAATNGTAHHSFAPHFDRTRQVTISGTVKEYEARNPHSYLHINAVDENGRIREYLCESHGFTQLSGRRRHLVCEPPGRFANNATTGETATAQRYFRNVAADVLAESRRGRSATDAYAGGRERRKNRSPLTRLFSALWPDR